MKASVFHVFISNKLNYKCEEKLTDVLKRIEVRAILYNSHVPCALHNDFLLEMEELGFIKLHNKRCIKVIR